MSRVQQLSQRLSLSLLGLGLCDLVPSYLPFLSPSRTIRIPIAMPPSEALIPVLVTLMLLTGVCNTLLTKYQVR